VAISAVVFLTMTLTALARNPIGTLENFFCFTPELDHSSDFSPSTDKGGKPEFITLLQVQ